MKNKFNSIQKDIRKKAEKDLERSLIKEMGIGKLPQIKEMILLELKKLKL